MKRYLLENDLALTGEMVGKKSARRLVAPKEAEARGYVPLGDVGAERLSKVIGKGQVSKKQGVNPFQDLFVSPAYREFIEQGTELVDPITSPVWKSLLKLKALTQTNKTVLSSATHGRNTFGNMIIMLANGMNPWSRLGPGEITPWKTTVARITGMTNKELGEYTADMQLRGVIDSSVRAQTLRKTAGDAFADGPNTFLKRQEKNIAGQTVKKTFQLYQAEDDIFKLMHFEKTLDDLRKLDLNVTDDALKDMAAQRTRDLMPNYNLVPKAIKFLRRTPFSDFPAFSAEMTRISKNLVKYSWNDITGKTAQEWGVTDPAKKQIIANMGWRRTAGMSLGAIAGDAGINYSKKIMGISEDDERAINRLAPVWEQNTRKIFLSPVNIDKNGHVGVDYVNLGPLDPFHYLRTPAQFLSASLKSGQEINDVDLQRLGLTVVDNALGMYINPSMITVAGLTAMGAWTPEERAKILAPGVLSPDMLSLGNEIIKPFIPGVADLFWKRHKYKQSQRERPDQGAITPYGYTMPEIEYRTPGFWAKAIGIRPQRMDISAGMRRNLNAAVMNIDKSAGAFTSAISREGGWTPDKYYDTFKDLQRKRIKEFQKLRGLTNAYDQLLSDARLRELKHPLIDSRKNAIYYGTTQNEKKKFNRTVLDYMEYARSNRYKPFWISENAEQAAQVTSPHVRFPAQEIQDLYHVLDGKAIANPASFQSLFY